MQIYALKHRDLHQCSAKELGLWWRLGYQLQLFWIADNDLNRSPHDRSEERVVSRDGGVDHRHIVPIVCRSGGRSTDGRHCPKLFFGSNKQASN